jgi:hypothetical protein
MITQEQADTASVFHDPAARQCDSKAGPVRWRRNGTTQRWARQPERFRIPVKFGLRSYGQLTNDNSGGFHTGADCPVAPEGHN